MEDIETAPRVRWLRALLAAFVAEVVLIVVAVPIFISLGEEGAGPVLNAVIPPASFVMLVLAGWWAARPEPRKALVTGALVGVLAVAIYLGTGFIGSLFAPGTSVTDGFTVPYLIAHVLKIAGGALGGWLVGRKAQAPTA